MKMGFSSNSGVPRRFDDPRIIDFRSRSRVRHSRQTRAPIIDPLRTFDAREYRLRMQQNLLAIIVLALILAIGLWLYDQLAAGSRMLGCIELEHANCMLLNERGLQR
jgi:hypothetical protein